MLLLLRTLTAMARHLGPTTFFNFANEGAGIMRNTPLRFPSKLPHALLSSHACKGPLHQSVQQALSPPSGEELCDVFMLCGPLLMYVVL